MDIEVLFQGHDAYQLKVLVEQESPPIPSLVECPIQMSYTAIFKSRI